MCMWRVPVQNSVSVPGTRATATASSSFAKLTGNCRGEGGSEKHFFPFEAQLIHEARKPLPVRPRSSSSNCDGFFCSPSIELKLKLKSSEKVGFKDLQQKLNFHSGG